MRIEDAACGIDACIILYPPDQRLDRQVFARLQKYTPLGDSDNDDTVTLLKLFLTYLPKEGALVLMRDILEQDEDDSLRRLRSHLVDGLLRPSSGGRTEPPTPSPMQEFEEKSDESFTGRERKKLRNSCLQRDSYRCVIFGHVDVSKRLDLAFRKPKERINATDCCHIIPSALASFGSDKTAEIEIKSTIWAAIYRYFPALKDLLSPQACNDKTENAITLSSSLHPLFGAFAISLEASHEQEDTYRILTFSSSVDDYDIRLDNLPADRIIRLSTTSPSLPLPHPDIIRAHNTIAKLLHESGIGEFVDSSLREMEFNTPSHLDPGGSTDIASIMSQKLLTGI